MGRLGPGYIQLSPDSWTKISRDLDFFSKISAAEVASDNKIRESRWGRLVNNASKKRWASFEGF